MKEVRFNRKSVNNILQNKINIKELTTIEEQFIVSRAFTITYGALTHNNISLNWMGYEYSLAS